MLFSVVCCMSFICMLHSPQMGFKYLLVLCWIVVGDVLICRGCHLCYNFLVMMAICFCAMRVMNMYVSPPSFSFSFLRNWSADMG